MLFKAHCGFTVKWEVCDSVVVDDTRPESEKHIGVGNTKFYILRQDLFIKFPFKKKIRLNPSLLRFLSLPSRDLIVSEDLIRNQRRSSLDDSFDDSLKGLCENTLSIPLNDPLFLLNNCSPIRDSFLLASSVHHQCVVKQSF